MLSCASTHPPHNPHHHTTPYYVSTSSHKYNHPTTFAILHHSTTTITTLFYPYYFYISLKHHHHTKLTTTSTTSSPLLSYATSSTLPILHLLKSHSICLKPNTHNPLKAMSSNVDASAVAVAESAAVPEDKPPPPPPARRFPPPCWTQEETLALIDAYRERWYSLRRGYLRTADWDAVAATVTSRCPDASPAKTSAQCRHKMEKLRQRYRAEKQRSLSCPTGRYFSSWFFFDNMDAMENGTTVAAIRSNNQQIAAEKQGFPAISGDGYALKTIIDQNLLKLKINSKNGFEDSPPNFMFNHALAPKNSEKINFPARVPNGYCSYMDNMGSNKEEQVHDVEYGSGFRMKNGISMKSKRTGRVIGDVNGYDHQGGIKGGNFVMNNNPSFDCDEGSEYNGSNNASDGFHFRNMGVSSSRRSYNSGNVEQQQQPNLDSRFNPGLSKFGKKGGGGGVGVKRGRDPVEEMVLSIKVLGEGFLKMEKMKMEMAKEVEQMRMEMEMKRNEMILESQKQIVEAFVKVLGEVHKNKNVKNVSPES